MDNVRVSQPVTGRGQRDVGSVVAAESACPVATAAVDLHQPDYRIGQVRGSSAVVNGSCSRDVKEPGAAVGLTHVRSAITEANLPSSAAQLESVNVNVESCLGRQSSAVFGHGLRPDAAPCAPVAGQPPAQRPCGVNGRHGTF